MFTDFFFFFSLLFSFLAVFFFIPCLFRESEVFFSRKGFSLLKAELLGFFGVPPKRAAFRPLCFFVELPLN